MMRTNTTPSLASSVTLRITMKFNNNSGASHHGDFSKIRRTTNPRTTSLLQTFGDADGGEDGEDDGEDDGKDGGFIHLQYSG